MDELPKVSIVVPVFNAGETLVPSIESLLCQSLKSLEIIIVNDASTDDSGSVIDRLSRENSNILPVHFTKNKGVHEARLAGLKKATANWIGFLDSDDFARPNMYEVMFDTASEHKVDIVVCGSYRVTPERKPIAPKHRFKRSEKFDSEVFGKFCRFQFGTGSLWNKLYRREVIIPYVDMHFPWRQNINEDLLLNIGCFHKAESVFLCEEILYEYVLNESSVTSTINNAEAYVDTYRAYALAVSMYSELGNDIIAKIIDMYRTQLTWGDYLIDDVSKILAHEERLEEACDLIFRTYPAALAFLSARKRPPFFGAKAAIRLLAHRCLTAVGIKSGRT